MDDQVVVDTVLDQPLGALRDVSYQLFCGDEILESAFEQRPDKLCVARQLAELMRLPLQEVLSDFDAITGISASGAKPRCSTWTARAACWTSSSLWSRSSGPWPSPARTATPSSTNPPAPSRGAGRCDGDIPIEADAAVREGGQPSAAAAKPSEMAGTPKPLRGKAAGTGPCRPGCARRSRRA